MLFAVHGLTVNGPVPIGCGSGQVSGCAAASPVVEDVLRHDADLIGEVEEVGLGRR